ncbi:MAG: cytidine deaminase [Maribacter sp.]|jgi:cytidine deaminase
MKKITIGTTIQVYESLQELSKEDRILVEEAQAATLKSYSPYSNFAVAASAILENGEMLSGANQENASFPLCLCAEMVLLSAISATYPGEKINTMAITIKSSKQVLDTPISPCGACRQTLLEFENRQQNPIRILLMGEIGAIYELASVKDLLPLSFDGSVL